MEVLIALTLLLAGTSVVLLALLLRRTAGGSEGAARAVREEMREGRQESADASRALREEVTRGQKESGETLVRTVTLLGQTQKQQLDAVAERLQQVLDANAQGLDRVRAAIDERLRLLQEGNERKLDEMRKTVDEKLQGTLEKRLGESFQIVSERLEAVHQGLGEMRELATGVGDLKRVLTNVKARGTWGEVQLGALLEQVLTPDQYARNVRTREAAEDDAGRDHIEFAVRLPGLDDAPGSCVWLPIDSKFPQEDYLRLLDAVDRAEGDGVQQASAALVRAVKAAAREISTKHVNPPHTTDFAILFLPTEGLYAEVLRQPGLVEDLHHTCRIVVAGPTTLTAILSSLRMGFRTLAIEKRSSEVWKVLGAVKTEFGRFGEVLAKVKKQLETAQNTINATGVRTRAMERRLQAVEALPAEAASAVLLLPEPLEDAADQPAPDPQTIP